MTMQKDFLKAMAYSGPESLPLDKQTNFDVLINVEVLTGCERACTGCFVDKNSERGSVNALLAQAKELADGVKSSGMNLREVVIGPTDIFTADNTTDVLMNKTLHDILFDHVNARITFPAKFDVATNEQFYDLFELLETEGFREDMIVELLTPIESPDKMLNDITYQDKVNKRVQFFQGNTKKKMDWSWVLQASNVLTRFISKDKLNELNNAANGIYGTILEMNPAFSRAPAQLQASNLTKWNEFLLESIDETNANKIMMTMASLYCHSFNFMGLTVIMGENGPETHLNTTLHEQAFFPGNSRTNVTGLSFEEILERRTQLITEGIQYAEGIKDCDGCPLVHACANRLVFEAMEDMQYGQCVLPKELINYYNPFQTTGIWNQDAEKVLGENDERYNVSVRNQ